MGDRIERPQRYIRGLVEYPPGQRQWLEYADKVEARIAQLEAERRWIPVGESLPKNSEYVLVQGGCAYYAGGMWWSMMGEAAHHPIMWEVTHWMPLPAPPEDK